MVLFRQRRRGLGNLRPRRPGLLLAALERVIDGYDLPRKQFPRRVPPGGKFVRKVSVIRLMRQRRLCLRVFDANCVRAAIGALGAPG